MRISLQNIKQQIINETNVPFDTFKIKFINLTSIQPSLSIQFTDPSLSKYNFDREIQYVTESNFISCGVDIIESIKSKYNV